MIGLRELALVALVVLVLYGRSGVLKSRRFQTIAPWISPFRRTGAQGKVIPARPASSLRSAAVAASSDPAVRFAPFLLQGNRLYWFLTILSATAVAAWIITRVLILRGSN
jgi:hypothetical protein